MTLRLSICARPGCSALALALACASPGVCAAQQLIGYVNTKDAEVTGVSDVLNGQAVLTGSASITARDHTAPVTLGRGGTVRVCQTSAVHITESRSASMAAPLLFSLDRGAMEIQMAGTLNDSIMTPDLRFTVVSAGPLDLRLRVARNGDTCVENRGSAAPTLDISDPFGETMYQISAGQHVLFEHGSLHEVVDKEKSPCGCPEDRGMSLADALLASGGPAANTVAPKPPVAAPAPAAAQPAPVVIQPAPVAAQPTAVAAHSAPAAVHAAPAAVVPAAVVPAAVQPAAVQPAPSVVAQSPAAVTQSSSPAQHVATPPAQIAVPPAPVAVAPGPITRPAPVAVQPAPAAVQPAPAPAAPVAAAVAPPPATTAPAAPSPADVQAQLKAAEQTAAAAAMLAAEQHPFPAAVSEGLVPASESESQPAPVAQVVAGSPGTTVTDTLSYNAPAPPGYPAQPADKDKTAAPAAKPAPPPSNDLLHVIGRFFKRLFGG